MKPEYKMVRWKATWVRGEMTEFAMWIEDYACSFEDYD